VRYSANADADADADADANARCAGCPPSGLLLAAFL
jgi:hypothetical protein